MYRELGSHQVSRSYRPLDVGLQLPDKAPLSLEIACLVQLVRKVQHGVEQNLQARKSLALLENYSTEQPTIGTCPSEGKLNLESPLAK